MLHVQEKGGQGSLWRIWIDWLSLLLRWLGVFFYLGSRSDGSGRRRISEQSTAAVQRIGDRDKLTARVALADDVVGVSNVRARQVLDGGLQGGEAGDNLESTCQSFSFWEHVDHDNACANSAVVDDSARLLCMKLEKFSPQLGFVQIVRCNLTGCAVL